MRRLILLTALLAAPALPQKPFVPPKLKGDRSLGATPAAANDEIISHYKGRHEAAVAALKAGNQVALLGRADDRVINLFLIAVKRDPSYPLALYDLGVMCAKEERWEDSINFYKEAAKADPSPEMEKLTREELERVQLLASLESTAEGKRRRQFDIEFVDLLQHTADPVPALELLNHAAKANASRWEAHALRGVLEAAEGQYPDSAHSLESAARMAPAERRSDLLKAAELARSEANFVEQMRNADLAMENHEYEKAGKLYASAWEIAPARARVGMQAAVGFLMADQIPLAVEVLQQLRQSSNPDYARKASAMLKELAAISDAAKAGPSNRSSETAAETLETAARIQKLVGDLLSPQMKIETRPLPRLLEDKTQFTAVPDPELESSDLGMTSSTSIFLKYQAYAAAAAPVAQTAPDGVPPGTPPSAETAPAPAAPTPPPAPQLPAETPARPARIEVHHYPANGEQLPAGKGVSVSSKPSGALVTFDKDPALTCTTPCSMPLKADRHTFSVTLPGYREALGIATAEKKVFDLTLEAKQGMVEVVSEAPGSPIYVDGQNTGKVTPFRLALPEGEHDVTIEVEGVRRPSQHLTVKDEVGYRIEFKF